MIDRSRNAGQDQRDVQGASRTMKRTVAALAGRRPDANDADKPRFPLAAAPIVRQAIRELFEAEKVRVLVSSAACGADLLAIDAADELGIRRIVVLPFAPSLFKASSVVDRPGDWGELYDRVINTLPEEDLIVLDKKPTDETAYGAANEAILATALMLAIDRERGIGDASVIDGTGARLELLAVLVWDGASRGSDDATASFKRIAERKGFRIRDVSTLPAGPARPIPGPSAR